MRLTYTNIFIAPAVALSLLASGCGKEIPSSEGGFPADGVIRVSAEVGPVTRGICTTENLREFDLLVGNNPRVTDPEYKQTVADRYCYQNTKFTLNGTEWTPAETMLWQDSKSPVTLMAIAPCLEGRKSVSDFDEGVEWAIKTEQTADDPGVDLLGWATPYDFTPANGLEKGILDSDGRVRIKFSHLLSKLTIRFKLGTEFNHDGVPSENIISGVEVGNVSIKARITLNPYNEDCPVSAIGVSEDSDRGVVKPYHTKWTKAEAKTGNCVSEYECILIPSASGHNDYVKIRFVVNGIPYKFDGSLLFEGGKAYTLTINVGKDEVVAGGVTASAWEDQPGETAVETD